MRRRRLSGRGLHIAGAGLLLVLVATLMGQGCPGPAAPGPGVNSGLTGDYIGSDECFICHANVHQNWSATRHARAYESLETLGQQNNQVCLTCHTTGFGEAGGFVDPVTTEALAHVGCESCHGPSGPHRRNVADSRLRPPKSIAAETCSRCHNSFHHDLYTQWASSGHSHVTADVAEYFTTGRNLNACGTCHSGDYRQALLRGEGVVVSDTLLQGRPAEQMNGVTCAICHDPHRNTGNAVSPPAGHDFQLRYAEVKATEPSNDVESATNPDRFNACGQCHHSRGRTWADNARGPHHSIQANFYVGEMPIPEGTAPIVPNTRTVHRFVFRQCATCHMQYEAPLVDVGIPDEIHANHSFHVTSMKGCVTSGCHPSEQEVAADTAALQSFVQTGLDNLVARMGPESTWQYSSAGGPAAAQQLTIPEQIRKVRFLHAYLSFDGSLGVHNPEYARAILREADILLTQVGR